jgi:hypothetical protein
MPSNKIKKGGGEESFGFFILVREDCREHLLSEELGEAVFFGFVALVGCEVGGLSLVFCVCGGEEAEFGFFSFFLLKMESKIESKTLRRREERDFAFSVFPCSVPSLLVPSFPLSVFFLSFLGPIDSFWFERKKMEKRKV